MHIILHEPEIPQNTGNIGRTCVATGTDLHLIKPMGFSIEEKWVRRSGLDYWPHLKVRTWENYDEFRAQHPGAVIWYLTTKAHQCYTDVQFGSDDYLRFGKESAGIPEELLIENEAHCIRIPMIGDTRSLNLSNSVAVVLYEALRQQNFDGLNRNGELHRLHWKGEESVG